MEYLKRLDLTISKLECLINGKQTAIKNRKKKKSATIILRENRKKANFNKKLKHPSKSSNQKLIDSKSNNDACDIVNKSISNIEVDQQKNNNKAEETSKNRILEPNFVQSEDEDMWNTPLPDNPVSKINDETNFSTTEENIPLDKQCVAILDNWQEGGKPDNVNLSQLKQPHHNKIDKFLHEVDGPNLTIAVNEKNSVIEDKSKSNNIEPINIKTVDDKAPEIIVFEMAQPDNSHLSNEQWDSTDMIKNELNNLESNNYVENGCKIEKDIKNGIFIEPIQLFNEKEQHSNVITETLYSIQPQSNESQKSISIYNENSEKSQTLIGENSTISISTPSEIINREISIHKNLEEEQLVEKESCPNIFTSLPSKDENKVAELLLENIGKEFSKNIEDCCPVRRYNCKFKNEASATTCYSSLPKAEDSTLDTISSILKQTKKNNSEKMKFEPLSSLNSIKTLKFGESLIITKSSLSSEPIRIKLTNNTEEYSLVRISTVLESDESQDNAVTIDNNTTYDFKALNHTIQQSKQPSKRLLHNQKQKYMVEGSNENSFAVESSRKISDHFASLESDVNEILSTKRYGVDNQKPSFNKKLKEKSSQMIKSKLIDCRSESQEYSSIVSEKINTSFNNQNRNIGEKQAFISNSIGNIASIKDQETVKVDSKNLKKKSNSLSPSDTKENPYSQSYTSNKQYSISNNKDSDTYQAKSNLKPEGSTFSLLSKEDNENKIKNINSQISSSEIEANGASISSIKASEQKNGSTFEEKQFSSSKDSKIKKMASNLNESIKEKIVKTVKSIKTNSSIEKSLIHSIDGFDFQPGITEFLTQEICDYERLASQNQDLLCKMIGIISKGEIEMDERFVKMLEAIIKKLGNSSDPLTCKVCVDISLCINYVKDFIELKRISKNVTKIN